jgi:biopolymer transport protein ExbB
MNDLVRALEARLAAFWAQAVEIWLDGGWAMVPIAVIAFVMFAMGMHIYLRLQRKSRLAPAESTWRRWIEHPNERSGELGEMLDLVGSGRSLEEMTQLFQQLRATECAPFERDLRVMRVCVSAAPLVGLLGTVTGMLATFGGLAEGGGGSNTMNMVAGGISEALITTETGLVIALPGLFFQYQLTRRFGSFKAFLAHLETVCAQTSYRAASAVRAHTARRAAAARVADVLRARLRETGQLPAGESKRVVARRGAASSV